MASLLEISNLSVQFETETGTVRAVDGVSLSLDEGKALAIVGESGCGKSMTALAILRLVPPPGKITGGAVRFDNRELMALDEGEMRTLRGNQLSMIFQDPMTSLNPVLRIGYQLEEPLRLHRNLPRSEARAEALELLRTVGIPAPEERARDYPHQLSGGMRQRVMIAMALACRPRLLIADEPTTALDVTIQAQILELMHRLRIERNMGLLLITHDMGVVAEQTEQTAVMYAGRIVEYGDTASLFDRPLHPYTEGLLNSLPQRVAPGSPLPAIPGNVPPPGTVAAGCGFCSRCPNREWRCETETPPLKEVSPGHMVRCWKHT
jgi:peptide/nickel transport system ATP-binding protein